MDTSDLTVTMTNAEFDDCSGALQAPMLFAIVANAPSENWPGNYQPVDVAESVDIEPDMYDRQGDGKP